MCRNAWKPLLTTDYKSCSHKVIVYGMCKMICRYSVGLKNNDILNILREGNLSLDCILECNLLTLSTMWTKSHNIRLARLYISLNLLDCEVTALSPLSVVSGEDVMLHLLVLNCSELLLSAEARICKTLSYQVLNISLVNLRSLSLEIRAILVNLRIIDSCSLVVEGSTALMCDSLIGKCSIEISKMYKSRRAWCKSCHLCPPLKLSCRELLLPIIRCLINTRQT